mmetsp:Transcript_28998/g.70003  ORF Transcript_28998/g.70003 Transcript_28998/m.70003 type:complete len:438 (-) Transcript_28998:624-1937(-)
MVRNRRLFYSTDQGIYTEINDSKDIDMDTDDIDIDDNTENLDEDDLLEDDGIDIMEEDRGQDRRHRHRDNEESEGVRDGHHQKDHFVDGILDHQMMAANNNMDRLHGTSDSGSVTDHPLLGHHNHQHQYQNQHSMSTPGQQFGHSRHENMMTSTATAVAFCKGMPMVMYMDGFQWALRHVPGSDHDGDTQHGCLTFYFPSWVLDTRRKFLVACLVVFCLGVWCEAVSRWRHNMTQHIKRASARIQRQNQQQQQQQSTSRRRQQQQQRQQQQRRLARLWYGQTFLHGISGLSVYLLMLATMTYSLEFLCAVVFGLMTGYFFFGGDKYKHAGSPCCTLFDNDDDDVTVATMTGNNNSHSSGGSSGGGGGSVEDNVDGDIRRAASTLAFPPQSVFSENRNMGAMAGDCCVDNRTDDEINDIQQPLLGKKSGVDMESKENV